MTVATEEGLTMNSVNVVTIAGGEQFEKETDISTLIADENLKSEETRRFLENAFRAGEIKTVGGDIDKIMPKMSRFGGGNREEKKKGIIIRGKKNW